MSVIKVNNTQAVEGKFSFGVTLDDSITPPKITIEGVFQSVEYIEEILSLESERYLLSDIKVINENFGSENPVIVYAFMAGKVRVKNNKGD